MSNQRDPQLFYFLQQDNFILFISLSVLYLFMYCESHLHLDVPTVIVSSDSRETFATITSEKFMSERSKMDVPAFHYFSIVCFVMVGSVSYKSV